MTSIFFASDFSSVQQVLVPVKDKSMLPNIFSGFDWGVSDFEAKQGEVFVLFQQGKKYYFLGLGNASSFGEYLEIFKKFSIAQQGKFSNEIGIFASHLTDSAEFDALLDATINGLVLGCYQLSLYKTDKAEAFAFQEIALNIPQSEAVEKACERGLHTALVQHKVMDLINAPANYMQPKDLVNWTRESGKEFGYHVKILDSQSLEDIGMKAILAVNKGSKTSPYCIVAEYKPENAPEDLPKIGLVGKGITYDTGGLNIKVNNMHYMKSDMGGSSIMLGTIELAARLQLPVHLITVIPATENDVDAESTKPGDVIGSYLGKTIEVIDTDAEGRLVLADGIAYLNEHYQPDIMIDAATLTGNSVLALGPQAGAMFSTDDELAQHFKKASESTGERVWRLPLWEVYADELKSDIADIKNYHSKPTAGAISAAKFLQFFTNNHPKWVHLDIAGNVFGNSGFGTDKSATGFGPRLMTEVLMKLKS